MQMPSHSGRRMIRKLERDLHEEERKALELDPIAKGMRDTGQRMGPSGLYVRGRRDEAARARKAMKIQAALAVAVGFSVGWIARSWLDWSQFQNMFGPTL